MSLIDTFNIGPLQQPQNFYVLNNSNNNFVFECTTLDVTTQLTVSPSFVDYLGVAGRGFTDVNETATLNVSNVSLNGLFVFQPQDENIVNVSNLNEMLFGVKNASFSFNYSDATVSKNGVKIPLYKDYINYLSQTIIGGPYNINQHIIKNTSQLYSGIQALNANFNEAFNLTIQKHRDPGLNASIPTLTAESYNAENLIYSTSCQQLIYGLLSLSNTNSTPNRITQFFEDISDQTPPYNFIFHPGDNFAIKITYKPDIKMNVSSSTIGVFNNRSYKIFLQVV
jgi:hypothetical protein